MSKTILSKVNGWTPIINTIVKDAGIMSAVVFGRMWRFCQMEDGVCKASLEKISEEIGIDRATVMRHAKDLCAAGYLKDLTPNLRNRPHIYADTGKASLEISITVAESDSAVLQKVIPTVAESKLKKDSKKAKPKKLKEGALAPRPLKANQIPQVILFRETTRRYPSSGSQFTVITSVDKVGDRLARDVIADDLLPYYREWCDRGYNPTAVKWLEWAVSGNIQTNGKKPLTQPKGVTVAQSWLEKKKAENVNA